MAPNSGPVGSITSPQGQGCPIVAELRDVSKFYGAGNNRVLALDHLSLKVRQGDYLAVMGASGSGKSTAMNILGCLDQPSDGEYWLDRCHTANLSDDQLADLRNRKLGFVFQQFYLLRELTALENVMLPMVYAGVSRPLQRQRAQEALVRVGLGERLRNRPNQLSGGQQQRVAIARAIINRPVMLLADEPTGALDSVTSNEVMDLFGELHREGMTVILVTHEHDVAARAEKILHFADGRIQEASTPASSSPAAVAP
ncbi:MAG: ABC transporter ATP-binding protein [Synechococcus sp. SB0668_bin_15]|nr:ABC transporter ATP-binding protein [Synechococcus sp. SB0668_bin_15]MXZ83251.1 ABC transporter ATP-binding protein [Synechococcus sp. SB0666_bin_14]MYC50673.1 ABC transporter ATP-binding protein [Synechococcus sp. SB0662_bin_14]MYG46258.1 ABC transporter ATP-binding protein [Synechococcus sp. SB0675_bin_6]MYJ59657.1 ABC transporter ATP-binding protein [Synechococcus sp. SB0672_bin_6]